MRTTAIALVLLSFSCSCPPRSATTPSPPPSDGAQPANPAAARTPAVAPDHAMYARVEGTSFKNDCRTDAECFKAGCSSEVCSAQEDVISTCEMPAGGFPTQGASCGCVANQCIWYREGEARGAAQGEKCGDGKCAAGLRCVEYYGIAGPRGPKFTSCEIACAGATACPEGQSCVTIADGPGQVCRPLAAPQ